MKYYGKVKAFYPPPPIPMPYTYNHSKDNGHHYNLHVITRIAAGQAVSAWSTIGVVYPGGIPGGGVTLIVSTPAQTNYTQRWREIKHFLASNGLDGMVSSTAYICPRPLLPLLLCPHLPLQAGYYRSGQLASIYHSPCTSAMHAHMLRPISLT